MEKEPGIKIEAKEAKDEGGALSHGLKEGIKKFPWLDRGTGRELEGACQEIEDFKEKDYENYLVLLAKAKEFSGDWQKERFGELKKETNENFAGDFKRLSVLRELINVEKLNPPPRLKGILEKYFKVGKMADKAAIELVIKNIATDNDYNLIERGLKFFDWIHISNLVQVKNSDFCKLLIDNEKFSRLEGLIQSIEEAYKRKLKFDKAKTNLQLLQEPDYIGKILSLKNEVEKLENYYNLNQLQHIDDFDKIVAISKSKHLNELLSDAFKEKADKVRKIYDLKGFKSVDGALSWLKLPDKDFKIISSADFAESIDDLGKKIGKDKSEIIEYFSEGNNLNFLTSGNVRELLKNKIVFSADVKDAKLDISEIFRFPSVGNVRPSPWGRIRETKTSDIAKLATFGRWGEGREPYWGWEYVAAARNVQEEDLGKNILNPEFLAEGIEGEPGLKKGKEIFNYVKNHLPLSLKRRFDKIFETLEERGEEGRNIELEHGNLDVNFTAGAYVRFDSGLDINNAHVQKTNLGQEEYKEFYVQLDRSFKAPSEISLLIGKGIEGLYDLMIKRKGEFEKQSKNLDYLYSHQNELSEEELAIIERKSKNVLELIELMENIYKSQRGAHLNDPSLHGRGRGQDPHPLSPQASPLRDRVFYSFEIGEKDLFANVKEYILNNPGAELIKPADELKIRLYSFSGEPKPDKLGEEFSLEIERNGKTKFLNREEAGNLLKKLSEYTLLTLYLENSSLLEVKEKNASPA